MAYVYNLGVAFFEVVQKNLNHPALLYPSSGKTVSYVELLDLSEKLAGALYRNGVRQNQVVGLFHDKSPEAYALMLACLRLGIVYVVFDPDSPIERLRKIIDTCQPAAVVNCCGSSVNLEWMSSSYYEIVVLEIESLKTDDAIASIPSANEVVGTSPAYIMFTSGSTGFPKGASISHQNLLWFINWTKDEFSIRSSDVFSNLNPMYFDNSVFDFYASIFNGATLIPVSKIELQRPQKAVRLLELAGCTIWFSVPSLLIYYLRIKAIDGTNLRSVKKFIFGGEGFPVPRLKTLFDLYSSTAELINVYGPTECTCICSAHRVVEDDLNGKNAFAPLGNLAKNFLGLILSDGRDLSDEDCGELFLIGPQVGLGYFNDQARTQKSFLQNPQHQAYTQIGYMTGDLVSKDSAGMLHFRGRIDNQIKHLGFRIELEEIESAISSIQGVNEVSVVYQKLDQGFGHIIAHVSTERVADPRLLRDYCLKLIPDYMIPHKFIFHPFLPKNQNGKIDKIALKEANE